ncbi:MAG: hypothetical protein LBP60_04000 [Spirochaetaceae bacterium]|jgi:hypothetical protein|nr:hypothetical protein [Spirochaetaceae bacterium]
MASRFTFSFLLGIILCLVSPILHARDLNMVQGFDREIFNYHFDRADREVDPGSWMREARRGLELALAGWERTALELYADPELRIEAEQNLFLWTEEELEKRYGEWLFKRFFGLGAGDMAKALDLAIDKANRMYAYHTGDEGTVLYGETGDPETVRPAEGRSVEEDLKAWNLLVSDAGKDELNKYQITLASSFPELLLYVREEDRTRFENRIKEISVRSLCSRQAEFEALLAREERLFIARRTGDIWSLRKQSENESAFTISSRLIKDAETACALGIASLEQRIEAAQAGTGDLSLAGTEWLAAFQEQFDRGLKAWADAEERFIIRRMEWERDSGELFLQGEEAWKAAFSELEKGRLAWEEEARELFNAGELLFYNVSEQLQSAINEARIEFQKDAALRSYSGAERAKALVEMYITCGSVLAEARESVNFWLSRFTGTPPADALEAGVLTGWVRLTMDTGSLSEGQKTAGQELIRWADIFTQYSAKARESIGALEREFGLVLGMDKAALGDVLALNSEKLFLDEYQVELLRTKAIARYWEQRYSIAQAVSAYAEELSAGRITEAEGLRQWRDSKAQYDEALAAYEEIQERLKNGGSAMASVQQELQNAAAALTEAEKKLEDLNSRYALQMAAYRVDSGDFILAELGTCYGALIEIAEKRRQDDAYYTAFLKAEQKYLEELILQYGWSLLRDIVINREEEEEELTRLKLSLLGTASGADWYFAVTGKEDTPEERKALEEEGLFNRLKQDAAQDAAQGAVSGKAARAFAVYREFFAYAPGLRREAAESAWRSLERVCAEFGYEGSEGTLPDMAALTDTLFLYGERLDIDPGYVTASLLEKLDRAMEMLPPVLGNEFAEWGVSLIKYMAAKTLYRGIPVSVDTAAILERYAELTTRMMEITGRGDKPEEELAGETLFYQYLVAFLRSYGEASTAAATAAAGLAAGEGPEHWRVYISEPRFDPSATNTGPAIPAAETGRPEGPALINGALSWEEGCLADAREAAAAVERKFSEALALLVEGALSGRQQEFMDTAASYAENPGMEWEYRPPDLEYIIALEFFKEESEKLENKAALELSLKQEIARLGFEYGKLPPSGQGALDQLRIISAELEQARVLHQQVLGQYSQKAAIYESEGTRYEALYGEAKNRFAFLETTRIEYEKQDAIQRWAGTAYLKQSSDLGEEILYYKEPAEEAAYAKERNNRAQAALFALQNLYAADEEKRPYDDGEYTALYNEYKDSFARMFLTLKAKTEFAAELELEQIKNKELYLSVSAMASGFANPQLRGYYESYDPSGTAGNSWMDFVRITESGGLGLSLDESSFILSPLDAAEAEALSDYFAPRQFTGDGLSQMSPYEEALAAWSARMADYDLGNMNSYQTWGLALDYIVRRIIESNPSVLGIGQSYELTDMGADGNIKLDGDRLDKLLEKYRANTLSGMQQNAWDCLSAQQKEDLEFLAILLLTGGGGDGAGGLNKVSEYREMDWLYDKADYYKMSKKVLFIRITIYRWPYTLDHSVLDQILRLTKNRKNAFYDNINYNRGIFSSGVSNLFAEKIKYEESCDKLAVFSKMREQGIVWDDIESALTLLENIENAELETLKKYWNEMQAYQQIAGSKTVYSSVSAALDGLYAWGKGAKDDLELRFENAYLEDQENRKINQDAYRNTLEGFINGEASMIELHDAAELAYGYEAPALKNHLENLGTVMISDLKNIHADRAVYTQQYRELASQYTNLIERAYKERFNAELAAREADWEEQQRDLDNKLAAWREAAGLIVERGRQDWKNGFESLQNALVRWRRNFEESYETLDAAWNAAYIESLRDKEDWINQAVYAAENALHDSLLTFVGADAESYGRKLDSFMPATLPGFGAREEASVILQNALSSAGITGLSGALTSMAGSAATILTPVRSGVSGIGVWDSGRAHEAAKAAAWDGTRELATGKMVLLAFQARESAYEAKRILEENVARNNSDFNDAMDEIYTMNGGWNRWGNTYRKDIIVHSTVFTSAITDRVTLDAYRWFVMEYWEFAADLSDTNLEGLDYLGVQALIALAQKEVQEKGKIVFGDGDSQGDFNIWIGESPEMIYGTITNPGSGELGRLMSELYKWDAKQAEGIAAMNAPLWNKPLWDSRGSWFGAPNMRVAADIANSIAATILTAVSPFTAGATLALAAGVNVLDEAIFYALDAAHGYMDWDDAGFAFGKKAFITTATTLAGAAFNGAGSAASSGFAGITAKAAQHTSGFGTVFTKTAMSGVQAISTGTVNSAIGAITYSNGKFGWSQDAFKAGFKEGLTGSLTASVSTFVSSSMNLGLEGFFDTYYADGIKLSSLTGGLAGQGLNYAFGGDFTLNAFNLGFINKNAAGIGLVELNFGRNGFNVGFGLGGVDVSLGTIAGAIQGLEAWKVNFDIWTSDSEDAQKYISQLRTLYSGGETTKEAYNAILTGATRIVENVAAAFTENIYDPVTGVKTIFLGRDALEDESPFGLNVVFSHEAYRNGIYDGAEGQQIETDKAVTGHITTALGLMQSYGRGAVGEAMAGEALEFLKNFEIFISGSNDPEEQQRAISNILDIFNSYDPSGDYWRLAKNSDGSYKLLKDNNHSLLDENGSILVRSVLDIFNSHGRIIGHHYTDEDSYSRSLGMLLGLYPDFNQGDHERLLEEYRVFIASAYDSIYLAGVKDVQRTSFIAPAVNVNPYLMTYKEIVNGRGITIRPDGKNSHVVVSIMDVYNKVAGKVYFYHQPGERDYVMVENMIPGGRRLKAGTISFEITGTGYTAKMFGLGTTMPDPSKMGKAHPAVMGNNYRYAWSLHNVSGANPVRGFRLFNGQPESWESVTGPMPQADSGIAVVPGFPYNTKDDPQRAWSNWATSLRNFPGYYYDESGKKILTWTNAINGHTSYSNPYVRKSNGYTAGSLGCQVWVPITFNQLTEGLRTTKDHISWGNFVITRSIFGDGTNKTNNWTWP